MMDMMSGMWGMSGMMAAMALFWLSVLAALAAGIWWLVRGARARPSARALDLLRERYARGEISREEFEACRKDLAA
jgi:putative membrane protein